MSAPPRLTASQWHVLEQAAVCPLFRCTGGWRGRDGALVSKKLANRLMTMGLVDVEYGKSGAHGPRLSLRLKGRHALDGRKQKVTA